MVTCLWHLEERLLRSEAGRVAVGLPADERCVGLLHLGRPAQQRSAPERAKSARLIFALLSSGAVFT